MPALKILEKLFAFVVVAPPIYLAVRYLRWYVRQNKEQQLETEQ